MAIALEDPAPDLQVERTAHGLRLRGTQLYLEPVGRPQLGFLAHARGARATLPERTVATAATVALLEAAQPRALRRGAPPPPPPRQPLPPRSLTPTLHPAGPRLGGAPPHPEPARRPLPLSRALRGARGPAPPAA